MLPVESCYDILCMLAQVSICACVRHAMGGADQHWGLQAVAGFREREVEQQTELEQLLELLESQNVEREQLEAEVVDKSTDVDLVMSQVEDMEDQVECVWSLVEAAALAASRAKASQAPDPSKPGGMDDAVKRKLQRMEHEIAGSFRPFPAAMTTAETGVGGCQKQPSSETLQSSR